MADNGPMPWLEGIEGRDAQKLIESSSQVIRVIAGPGSGKTTCLERRIQRLIEKNKVDPNTVFVGSFTRAITRELRKALDPRVKVTTIHSLAYELLRKYPETCQGMQLRFLLKYEEDSLLYDIKHATSDVRDIHKLRKALKKLQASRSQLTEYPDARFAGEVRRWMQKYRAMLIGEVIYLCVIALESEDIPPRFFDHVVIDEYQDLTAAEQELVQLIWSGSGSLSVVGDNDQSIYGFRFNHPKGIEDFNPTGFKCENLEFPYNFRCGKDILTAANLMMIEANSKKDPMILKNTRAGKLKPVYWETLTDEIDGLARYLRAHKESFLVLVPRRFIGYRLADAIGSDAKTMFSEQVLEHPIAQESFSTASLLANPEDFVAARAYLGFRGSKKEHEPSRNAVAYASLPTGIGGHELIRLIAKGAVSVSGSGKSYVRKRAEMAVELIDRSLTASETIDLVFDGERANEESDNEKRRWLVEDLEELHSAAHELLSMQDPPDLLQVLSILRHRIATRDPLQTSDDRKPRVKIMTLHSAKGLEEDNVVIAGVADQFMPGVTEDLQDVEEKRRLLYVAVTRAKDSLIISWPRRILATDMYRHQGRVNTRQIRTYDSNRWVITTRSRLLPMGLRGVIPGSQLLSSSL